MFLSELDETTMIPEKKGTDSELKSKKIEQTKDSILAKVISEELKSQVALDEVTGDWYMASENIWQRISKVRATKVFNEALHRHLLDGFAFSRLTSVESFLKLYLALDNWESSSTLLPMQNGVLDAKTMLLTDYGAEHKFRWQLPYRYEEHAEINVIKQWLNDYCEGDLAAVKTIRAFFKIALIGGNFQKFLEVVGPGGTGKSTLIRLLIMLIGERNHAATDLRNLEQNRFEAATLYGKKLAVISDSSRYGG